LKPWVKQTFIFHGIPFHLTENSVFSVAQEMLCLNFMDSKNARHAAEAAVNSITERKRLRKQYGKSKKKKSWIS
jgi:hypothetical protein